MFKLTLIHTCGIAVVLRFGLIALTDHLPRIVTSYLYTSCFILALSIFLVDRLILFPYFRSPLRVFPTVRIANVIAERPRGKTPLKWFAANPNADAIVMHSKYTGRDVLFPTSAEALRDIMSTNTYHWEKPYGIRAFLGRVIGFGLIMSEGDAHKKQRKVLTPAFNIKNIRACYPLMWTKVGVLVEQLRNESKNGTAAIEISHWASRLTLDIIGPTALSRDFGTMTSEDDPVAEAFGEILDPSPELITFMVANIFIPQFIMTRMPVKSNKIIKTSVRQLRELCRTILTEKHDKLKTAEEGIEEDILQNIISSGQFSDDEVIDQMLTFLAAGHETTASALTWCMYLLAKDKDIQNKLRQEVQSRVSTPVTSSMLEALPLLNGVCEETFRLFPTVPLTVRESVCDTMIAGVEVPKGTHTLIVPYAINRHPMSWGADAEKFSPERWIDKTPEGDRPNKHGGAHSNYCEVTFLHGSRSCIGRDFAKAEMRCAVAGLVGSFQIDLVHPDVIPEIGGTVTTKPMGGLELRLTPLSQALEM